MDGKAIITACNRYGKDFCLPGTLYFQGEQQSLPGFEENAYALIANAQNRHLKDLKEEMLTVRLSTIQLFQGFDSEMFHRTGLSNQKLISVLALGYIIIGHWRHHAGVLQAKYGIGE